MISRDSHHPEVSQLTSVKEDNVLIETISK